MATKTIKDNGYGRAVGSQTVSMQFAERQCKPQPTHETLRFVGTDKSPVSRRGRKARRAKQAGFSVGMYETAAPAAQPVKRSQPVLVARSQREVDCLSLAQPRKPVNNMKGAVNGSWNHTKLMEKSKNAQA